MNKIIDINAPRQSMGSKFEQQDARFVTNELAVKDLTGAVGKLMQTQNFMDAIVIEAFKRLGIDLQEVANDLNKKAQEEMAAKAGPVSPSVTPDTTAMTPSETKLSAVPSDTSTP